MLHWNLWVYIEVLLVHLLLHLHKDEELTYEWNVQLDGCKSAIM